MTVHGGEEGDQVIEFLDLPSPLDSYNRYDKNQWGRAVHSAPHEQGGIFNTILLDTDFENFAVIYVCDDHPTTVPYPNEMVEVDENGEMKKSYLVAKGLRTDLMLLTRSPEGITDKKMAKEVNAKIAMMTGGFVDFKNLNYVTHDDTCVYN